MKKKNVVLISSIVLAVLLVVGGTMAWFTDKTDPVVNTFKTGTVKIKVNDTFNEDNSKNINPGDKYEKKVSVTNEGTKKAYIRVKLTPKWDGELENVVNGIKMAEYEILNGWVYHEVDGDGWYYYPHIVEKEATTPNIIEEVKFAGKEMSNTYQGKQFTLTVEAQAIQASNGAALDEWDIDPSTLAPDTPAQ